MPGVTLGLCDGGVPVGDQPAPLVIRKGAVGDQGPVALRNIERREAVFAPCLGFRPIPDAMAAADNLMQSGDTVLLHFRSDVVDDQGRDKSRPGDTKRHADESPQ